MDSIHRRRFLKFLPAAPIALYLIPATVQAEECNVPHPIMPPNIQYQGQCPVCGMVRVTGLPADGITP